MINRNVDLERRLIKAAFGRDVILLDTLGLGAGSPFIVDGHARRHENGTTASLLGGSWARGKAEDGTVIEVFGKFYPAYSCSLSAAWELIEHLRGEWLLGRDNHGRWPRLKAWLQLSSLWDKTEADAASMICETILLIEDADQ